MVEDLIKRPDQVEYAMRELSVAFIDATVHAQAALALVKYVRGLESVTAAQAARIAELEAAIRKQANAARSLADATIRDASIRQGLAEKAYAESSPEVLASERQANAMLTEENERLTARITALESERDALLAAAGKEAVGQAGAMPGTDGFTMACFKASDVPIGTPLYTAPTAALEKGDGRDAWISVDERLPEEDSVVLVSAWEYGKLDGKRFTLVARRSGSLFLNEETGDDLYTPTHWQPLPEAPAALSQKAGEQQ